MNFIHLKNQLARALDYSRSVAAADRTLLARRALLLLSDCLVLVISFWAGFALRLNALWPDALQDSLFLLPSLIVIGLSVLIFSGWYQSLTRAAGSHSFYSLLPRTTLIVLLLIFISTIHSSPDPPRSFWFLLWSLLTSGLVLSRVLARDVLRWRLRWNFGRTVGVATLIYGAGEAGVRLLQELKQDKGFHLVAVIDDSPRLWKRRLHDLPVCPPSTIPGFIQSNQVTQVLLAIPSLQISRRREITNYLTSLGLKVLTIPSLSDIASGRQLVSELRSVSIFDLLGRPPSSPIPGLLESAVSNKNILVTGAGGSIGSELCRQLLSLNAKSLILLERSEFALYSIHQELSRTNYGTTLIPSLSDASDQTNLEYLLTKYKVHTLIHAAAYKHVPLVESNPCSAVKNNVCSTKAAISAALACNLERFTLISTDKAVRPTNVMGASKRLCEMLVQNASSIVSKNHKSTVFSMVRFGNVLGSSGSVVPLFQKQISAGGPVTVTHPDITRYFMTIPEAVQLVLQASALSTGGEVFLLDMGEPIRIADLARQMIQLSGFSVKDEINPGGDIFIEYTGLRPGEKLFEELLITNVSSDTPHPLIKKANEYCIASDELSSSLTKLNRAIEASNTLEIRSILKSIIPEYEPSRPDNNYEPAAL